MKMSDQKQAKNEVDQENEESVEVAPVDQRLRGLAIKSLALLVVFAIGILSGYLMWGLPEHDEAAISTAEAQDESMALMRHINPPEGYTTQAVFGDIGPKMVAAGAIDLTRFIELYNQQERPLTDEQMDILTNGTGKNIAITEIRIFFPLGV
jgi:hypothetical protein